MTSPITKAIDELNRLTLERHGWLSRASEQVRQWKEEDARNGVKWGDSK